MNVVVIAIAAAAIIIVIIIVVIITIVGIGCFFSLLTTNCRYHVHLFVFLCLSSNGPCDSVNRRFARSNMHIKPVFGSSVHSVDLLLSIAKLHSDGEVFFPQNIVADVQLARFLKRKSGVHFERKRE